MKRKKGILEECPRQIVQLKLKRQKSHNYNTWNTKIAKEKKKSEPIEQLDVTVKPCPWFASVQRIRVIAHFTSNKQIHCHYLPI